MKKIVPVLLLTLIILLFKTNASAQNNATVLRHIVTITFKPDANADSIQALDDVYIGLSKNTMVKDFEWGVNMSSRDTTLKHVYVTSFSSKEDMDSYKKLPLYSSLFKRSSPVAAEVTVADYWAKK
jgi:hypothetical protein